MRICRRSYKRGGQKNCSKEVGCAGRVSLFLDNCLQSILPTKATLPPRWGQAVQGSTRGQELAKVRYCPLMISDLKPEWLRKKTEHRQSTSLAARWQSQRKALTSDKIHAVVPSLWSWMLPESLYSAVPRRYMRVYCRMLPAIIHISPNTAGLTVVIAFHRMKSLPLLVWDSWNKQ